MFGGKIKSPPVKVLSSQLRDSKVGSVTNGITAYSIKRLGNGKATPLMLSVVWMQGTVVDISSDQDTVSLLDEAGNFTVRGVNSIPKGKPCLINGKYVMVMGTIQSHAPEPILRAVKMADLSENAAIHRAMWKYEVEDLQKTLT